jgi:uncharacterized membrane protein
MTSTAAPSGRETRFDASSASGTPAGIGRLTSLDIARGAVMILMAIDHVRVYSGLPAGGPTPGIFFTRWVTHFSAPVFAFLLGTGAFLHGRKLGDRPALSRYLATRGAILILLELTVIRVGWTFNVDFAHYLLAGVIWMLGWCMILLAAAVRLSTRTVGILGVTIMIAQSAFHVLDKITPAPLGWLAQLLFLGGAIQVGANGPTLFVLYTIVPWVGVVFGGYAFGSVMMRPAEDRRRFCLRVGLGATAVFLILGVVKAVSGGGNAPFLLRVLGQSKYQDNQIFLMMTLGPMIALLPLFERARGMAADAVATFGRVPMFYYLLHIPLIHGLACVVSMVREGHVNPWLFANFPVAPGEVPEGYTWSLPLLYLVFVVAIALLYVPCRWYAQLKASRRYRWTTYI